MRQTKLRQISWHESEEILVETNHPEPKVAETKRNESNCQDSPFSGFLFFSAILTEQSRPVLEMMRQSCTDVRLPSPTVKIISSDDKATVFSTPLLFLLALNHSKINYSAFAFDPQMHFLTIVHDGVSLVSWNFVTQHSFMGQLTRDNFRHEFEDFGTTLWKKPFWPDRFWYALLQQINIGTLIGVTTRDETVSIRFRFFRTNEAKQY